MSYISKMPMLRTYDVGSILLSCAAFAVSASFADAMWMMMR